MLLFLPIPFFRLLLGTDPIKSFGILFSLRGGVCYDSLSIQFLMFLEPVQEGIEILIAGVEDLLPCRSYILNNWVSRHDLSPRTNP